MEIDFNKGNGLVPAVVQDYNTGNVLMLGYMNEEALAKTIETGNVTFFSRSKNRLWMKGETSGNILKLVSAQADCDNDALLIKAIPRGPVCHKGTDTCWGNQETNGIGFLSQLETIIEQRRANPSEKSYVSSLFKKGINKIAQKVGEEAVEVIIEAKDRDKSLFLEESADLLFHYLILLNAKGNRIEDVIEILKKRHKLTTFANQTKP